MSFCMMQEQTVSARLTIERTLQLKRALRFVWQSAKGWTIANGVLLCGARCAAVIATLSHEAHGGRRDRRAGGS
jgi:hypothetical protein